MSGGSYNVRDQMRSELLQEAVKLKFACFSLNNHLMSTRWESVTISSVHAHRWRVVLRSQLLSQECAWEGESLEGAILGAIRESLKPMLVVRGMDEVTTGN